MESNRLIVPKKVPTSQLVFYMENAGVIDKCLRSKVEVTLYDRLIRKYKLYPDKAKRFVEREKQVIGARGDALENYSFGKDRSLNDFLTIFYENVKLIGDFTDLDKNFNTLTMSEMVEFYSSFLKFKNIYKKRLKMFEKAIKKNTSDQNSILSAISISFETKEDKINKLKELRQVIEFQKKNEKYLIEHNEYLAELMIGKIETIMGDCGDTRAILTVIKEALLLPKSPLRSSESKQYSDIDFDAYAYDTALISKYNVQGYPFSKKR